MCQSYCSHGGRCTEERGHTTLHDSSGHCQWTDKEAISREEADALLARTQSGQDFLDIMQPLADMIEEVIDEENE